MSEEGKVAMASLQDWKAALASGVKIETLLGLNQDGTVAKQQTTGKQAASDIGSMPGVTKSKEHTVESDVNVRTTDGQILEFQWSSPSITSLCTDVHGDVSQPSASNMVVSPPSVPMKQIFGPCFIDITSQHGGKPGDHPESNQRHSSEVLGPD